MDESRRMLGLRLLSRLFHNWFDIPSARIVIRRDLVGLKFFQFLFQFCLFNYFILVIQKLLWVYYFYSFFSFLKIIDKVGSNF